MLLLIPTVEHNSVQIHHESFIFANLCYYLHNTGVILNLTDISGNPININDIPIYSIYHAGVLLRGLISKLRLQILDINWVSISIM